MEIGSCVNRVAVGNRVITTRRHCGTWRYYGVFNETDLHIITKNLSLEQASLLAVAPCTAYRLLKDFRNIHPGQTVLLNGANSICGQYTVQLCKALGYKSCCIVSPQGEKNEIIDFLYSLGADCVLTLQRAFCKCFNTSLERPVIALNCMGGLYEDVLLKMLDWQGTIVYYDCAYFLPFAKRFQRSDVDFQRFHLHPWDCMATTKMKMMMYDDVAQMMIIGQLCPPLHESLYMRDYPLALENTAACNSCSTKSYILDLTIP